MAGDLDILTTHTYVIDGPDNFLTDEPKFERKHLDLDNVNVSNETEVKAADAVKYAGATEREINITFATTIGSNN